MRRAIYLAILSLAIVLMVFVPSASPYPANSVDGFARPSEFNIVGWGLQNIRDLRLQLWPAGHQPYNESTDDTLLVLEYYELNKRIDELYTNGQTDEASRLQLKTGDLINQVDLILIKQISQILHYENLTSKIGGLFSTLFPPIEFRIVQLPLILIVSPRERIELKQTVLLDPGLKIDEIIHIENNIETLGLSAEIERVGGVALYPTMVPRSGSLSYVLSVIAHEWFHHYLFFKPLGRAYRSSPDMTTINETAADIVGNEIGGLVYSRYYEKFLSKSDNSSEATSKSIEFDFNKEMRITRLVVDWYLEHDMIEEAERYMEERRLVFVEHGYVIRKLNQAYFAFHGSYADSPASVSPIGEQLALLRTKSGSLEEFVEIVSRISSPDDLVELSSDK